MVTGEINGQSKKRLVDLIAFAQTGASHRLHINIYRNLLKRVIQSESTDDINIEADMDLYMADFALSEEARGKQPTITKVYAVRPLGDDKVDDTRTRLVANERLKMDYDRLKEANVQVEEKYF